MDPEVTQDLVAGLVEEVGALAERAAVGADVRADGPDRSHPVDDEGALAVGERVLAAPAFEGGELVAVPIEDVDPAGAADRDVELVVDPAVGEVVDVGRRRDRRVFGVGTVGPEVGGLVVAGGEREVVVDQVLPGGGVERAVVGEEVHPALGAGLERVGDRQLHPGGGVDVLGRLGAERLLAGVAGHQGDLVVAVHGRIRVGTDPGVRVGVLQGGHADGLGPVDGPGRPRDAVRRRFRAEVDDGPLVDLHRDRYPGAGLAAEGGDPVGGHPEQRRERHGR